MVAAANRETAVLPVTQCFSKETAPAIAPRSEAVSTDWQVQLSTPASITVSGSTFPWADDAFECY